MSRVTIIESANNDFLKDLLSSMSEKTKKSEYSNTSQFVSFLRGLRPYIPKREFIEYLKGRFDGLNFVKMQKHFAYLYFRNENDCNEAIGSRFLFRGCRIEIVKYSPFKRTSKPRSHSLYKVAPKKSRFRSITPELSERDSSNDETERRERRKYYCTKDKKND